MKNLKLVLSILFLAPFATNAQSKDAIVVYVNENATTHFISEQKLYYTDLSTGKTGKVDGDMPMDNILRIKPSAPDGELGFATIVGENFFLQFALIYTKDPHKADLRVDLDDLIPSEGGLLGKSKSGNYDNPEVSLTGKQIENYAKAMLNESPSLNNVKSKVYKMKMRLNNIWVVDDYIFFDYSLRNKSNLIYNIDETRFKIVDKKVVKSESNQDQLLNAEFHLNSEKVFDKKYRNIVAIKKFTYPDDKQFIIELSEDQISGRTTKLHISYSDLLSAKSFRKTIPSDEIKFSKNKNSIAKK